MTHSTDGLPDPLLDSQFYDGVLLKRVAAGAIDFVLITLLVIAFVIFTLGLAIIVIFPLVFIISFAYRVFFIRKFSGTLGMRFVGIELRDAHGNRFDSQTAMTHTGLFLLAAVLLPLQLINLICMILTDRGQGLHDLFLGTTAINRPAP